MRISLAAILVCVCVGGMAAAQNVTSVEARVVPVSHNGSCPAVFQVKGVIQSAGPGTVSFRWERSDNTHTGVARYTFRARERKIVTYNWRLSKPSNVTYHGWVRLHVVAPVSMESPAARFELHCR